MKILHICQRDDPDTGGSLRVAEALVHEQKSAGYEAWILFLYGAPSHVAESLAPNSLCLELKSSRQALQGVKLLCKAIRQVQPDIIHSHDGIVWPRLAVMCFRIPVVMHSHLPVASSGSWMSRVLIKSTTDILIGISLHTIDTWVEAGFPPSQIHYVPNGVDFGRFGMVDEPAKEILRYRLGLPAEKHLLLWVGRLHRSMKGSDRVERIAGLLPDGMVLVVVGNGPEFEGINSRCHSLIEEGKMIMAGTASVPEDYYQAADSFLFTSYYEPFGLVILEAVSCGLPIFTFPVSKGGGAVELLKEFDATMIEDQATDEGICSTLSRDAVRGEAGRKGRERAMLRYSWSQTSGKVVDVYKLLLNKTR